MKLNSLKDDLIRDFQDQKRAVNEQVALIDPMATSLRKPAAKRLLNTGFIVMMEVLSWLLFLGCIAFIIFMDKLYPFYYLNKIVYDTALPPSYPIDDMKTLSWIIRGMALVSGLLFFAIARMLATIRNKNSILHLTGKNLKLLAEQLLQRKANMAALEQRNPIEMPSNTDTVIVPQQKPHDDILL